MSANIEDFEYYSENADKDLLSGDDSDKDPDIDLSSYIFKMQGHLSDEEEHALPARKRPLPPKKRKKKVNVQQPIHSCLHWTKEDGRRRVDPRINISF